ncbi:MAG: DUF126 domain-containing protein [Ignisphaera sp.]
MHNRCIELSNVITIGKGNAFGKTIKLDTLSFLGDVDRESGKIIAQDLKAKGKSLASTILVVKRFRGSTVGVYVLYSLCKKGLAPKAILMVDPDPVVVTGMILCNIIGVAKLPEDVYNTIADDVDTEVGCYNGTAKLCFQ